MKDVYIHVQVLVKLFYYGMTKIDPTGQKHNHNLNLVHDFSTKQIDTLKQSIAAVYLHLLLQLLHPMIASNRFIVY